MGVDTHTRTSTTRTRKSAKRGTRFLVVASHRVVVVVVVVAMVERSGATAKFKVISENEASHFSLFSL